MSKSSSEISTKRKKNQLGNSIISAALPIPRSPGMESIQAASSSRSRLNLSQSSASNSISAGRKSTQEAIGSRSGTSNRSQNEYLNVDSYNNSRSLYSEDSSDVIYERIRTEDMDNDVATDGRHYESIRQVETDDEIKGAGKQTIKTKDGGQGSRLTEKDQAEIEYKTPKAIPGSKDVAICIPRCGSISGRNSYQYHSQVPSSKIPTKSPTSQKSSTASITSTAEHQQSTAKKSFNAGKGVEYVDIDESTNKNLKPSQIAARQEGQSKVAQSLFNSQSSNDNTTSSRQQTKTVSNGNTLRTADRNFKAAAHDYDTPISYKSDTSVASGGEKVYYGYDTPMPLNQSSNTGTVLIRSDYMVPVSNASIKGKGRSSRYDVPVTSRNNSVAGAAAKSTDNRKEMEESKDVAVTSQSSDQSDKKNRSKKGNQNVQCQSDSSEYSPSSVCDNSDDDDYDPDDNHVEDVDDDDDDNDDSEYTDGTSESESDSSSCAEAESESSQEEQKAKKISNVKAIVKKGMTSTDNRQAVVYNKGNQSVIFPRSPSSCNQSALSKSIQVSSIRRTTNDYDHPISYQTGKNSAEVATSAKFRDKSVRNQTELVESKEQVTNSDTCKKSIKRTTKECSIASAASSAEASLTTSKSKKKSTKPADVDSEKETANKKETKPKTETKTEKKQADKTRGKSSTESNSQKSGKSKSAKGNLNAEATGELDVTIRSSSGQESRTKKQSNQSKSSKAAMDKENDDHFFKKPGEGAIGMYSNPNEKSEPSKTRSARSSSTKDSGSQHSLVRATPGSGKLAVPRQPFGQMYPDEISLDNMIISSDVIAIGMTSQISVVAKSSSKNSSFHSSATSSMINGQERMRIIEKSSCSISSRSSRSVRSVSSSSSMVCKRTASSSRHNSSSSVRVEQH